MVQPGFNQDSCFSWFNQDLTTSTRIPGSDQDFEKNQDSCFSWFNQDLTTSTRIPASNQDFEKKQDSYFSWLNQDLTTSTGFLLRTRISKKTRIPGCSWLEPGTTRIPALAKKFLVFYPRPGFLVVPGYCDLKLNLIAKFRHRS